jgi:DNA-binding XRE family transcriptional regulator
MYERRRALGMAQRHLAGVVGVHRDTMTRAENGGNASPELIERADVYLTRIERAHAEAVAALS